MSTPRVRHLALVGCTASGKSELALELARHLQDVELVTVDSMQVYRGMDIGTAKPSPAERAAVPHHMLDLADPDEEWSVKRWADEAARVIDGIESRNHRALLVGGTGLYFQALVDGLTPPPRYPAVRQELERTEDTAQLHRRLQEVDPLAASRMEPFNRRRVIRALEVTLGSGRLFSSYGPGMTTFPPTQWSLAALWLPRAQLARRIEARLQAMIERGLVEETDRLRHTHELSRTARQALGYREILAHLETGIPIQDAIADAVRRTRSFARRQRVWWRRDPRIRWYGVADNPLAVMSQLLGDWKQA